MAGVRTASHVLPSPALIRELLARGHRITYANDPSVAGRTEAARAEPVPCTTTLPVTDNHWPADPIAPASLSAHDADQALPQLRAAFGDLPEWHVIPHPDPAQPGTMPATACPCDRRRSRHR